MLGVYSAVRRINTKENNSITTLSLITFFDRRVDIIQSKIIAHTHECHVSNIYLTEDRLF